ncbi:guanine nucleotide exchange protein for ADP-robosylation factor [Basidiobolus ranarum]|uniref:Guanine nucleotide exchange protein for ADP-robosylation factor n=1 Tax=Basidiobolus ranarum TaxID=34480 RepID=A0ABR2W4P3_9FUNG
MSKTLEHCLERLLKEAEAAHQKGLQEVCQKTTENLRVLKEVPNIILNDKVTNHKVSTSSEELPSNEISEQISEDTEVTADEQEHPENVLSDEVKDEEELRQSQEVETPEISSIHSTKETLDIQKNFDISSLTTDYWAPFKLACTPTMPTKIREIALDSIQKLAAFSYLKGTPPISTVDLFVSNNLTSSNIQTMYFSNTNDLSYIKELVEASEATLESHKKTDDMIEDIIDTICASYTGSEAEDAVELQVIKALLTLVTGTSCEIHGVTLMKAIQTCCNAYVYSSSPINQMTAKAALIQMVNLTISRMEHFSELAKKYPELDFHSLFKKYHLTSDSPQELATAATEATQTDLHNDAEVLNNVTGTDGNVTVNVTPDETDIGEPHSNDPNSSSIEEPQQLKQTDEPNVDISGTETEPNGQEVDSNANGITEETSLERDVADSQTETSSESPKIQTEKGDIEPASINIYSKVLQNDVFVVFRQLCLLSVAPELPNQEPAESSMSTIDRARGLALELILSMLNNSGPTFQTEDLFADLVRQYLCISLSKNGVSSEANLFEFSLSIFLIILHVFRGHLKSEIELLFNEIYLRILEMPNSTFKQKQMVLQGLNKICSHPQALVDIYLNYDCDISTASIFERIVNSLSRIAQGRTSKAGSTVGGIIGTHAAGLLLDNTADLAIVQENRLKLRGLKCLVAIIDSLVDWGKDPHSTGGRLSPEEKKSSEEVEVHSFNDRVTSPTLEDGFQQHPVIVSKNPLHSISLKNFASQYHGGGSPSSLSPTFPPDDDPARFEVITSRKQTLNKGVRHFNMHPKKGLKFLIENEFVTEDPAAIATFLKKNPALSKASVGEYLGDGDSLNIQVMHAFIEQMNFKGLSFVTALREFLQSFRLPGEAQKIDRIMEKFADCYCEANPELFANADTAYILAFSIIMLNTDQHSSQVKNRMDKQAFIHNNRGISVDLSTDFLGEIFDDISTNEIVMNEEKAMEMAKEPNSKLHKNEVVNIEYKMVSLLSEHRPTAVYRSATHADHVKPMFAVAWCPLMATLSLIFEHATDARTTGEEGKGHPSLQSETISLCLNGFEGAIRICCLYRLEIERDAFISSLAKLTALSQVKNLKYKNIAAVRSLLSIAQANGEYLESSWEIILYVISQMERLQLIGDSAIRPSMESPTSSARASIDTVHSDSQNTRKSSWFGSLVGAAHYDSYRAEDLRARPALATFVRDLQSQETLVVIDRIFSRSVNLSGNAILHFYRALCKVSLDEVEGNRSGPRMFSMQKIVEITYYNMSRIRFEWAQIWSILQPHFNTMGCNSNPDVATFAIDSLRQLSTKFLERDELAHFHTQNEFLKPFEYIINHNKSAAIQDLIIQSLNNLVSARSNNIKSGWKIIFLVCGRIAEGGNDELVKSAFDTVEQITQKYFDLIGPVFVDLTSCIVDFVFQGNSKIIHKAIDLLHYCVGRLVTEATTDNPPTLVRRYSLPEEPTDTATIEEERLFLKWFPLFSGLSRIAVDSPSSDVRDQALSILFDSLRSSGKLFDATFWSTIFRSVLLPLFEDLQDEGFQRREELIPVWSRAIDSMIELYSLYFDVLSTEPDFVKIILNMTVEFTKTKNENLSQKGITSLQKMIEENTTRFTPELWELCVATLLEVSALTTPTELFYLDPNRDQSKQTKKIDFMYALLKCSNHLMVIQAIVDLSSNPKAPLLQSMPANLRSRVILCIHQSYKTAHDFNTNYELRLHLWKAGYVQQMPNLVKQEMLGLSSYLQLTFDLYKLYGDDHDTELAEADKILPLIVNESTKVLTRYIAMLEDQVKYNRDIAIWSRVVVTIYKELVEIPWEVQPSEEMNSQSEPPVKLDQLRKEIKGFFLLGVKMISVDRPEVREILEQFFEKIANKFLKE